MGSEDMETDWEVEWGLESGSLHLPNGEGSYPQYSSKALEDQGVDVHVCVAWLSSMPEALHRSTRC